jgi:Tfp pilus assembly protein PilF
MGRFDEADKLLREAINQIEKDSCSGSDAWLRMQMYLVDCCIQRGRFDEAEERLKNCAENPDFDGTILLSGLPNNIFMRWAALCFNRGQYALAVQHYTRTLHALEIEASSKFERQIIDQLTAEITIELAIMYCKAQMVDKAAAIARGVSQERAIESVYGVLFLTKLNYVLGVVALNDGELSVSTDYLEKALNLGRQFSILSRDEVADVTSAMAMLAEANQDNALADNLFRQALEAKQGYFGIAHPQTAYVLEAYGAYLTRAGQLTKADAVLLQAKNIRASIKR